MPIITSSFPWKTFYVNTKVFGQANGSVGFFNNPNADNSTAEMDLAGEFTPRSRRSLFPIKVGVAMGTDLADFDDLGALVQIRLRAVRHLR